MSPFTRIIKSVASDFFFERKSKIKRLGDGVICLNSSMRLSTFPATETPVLRMCKQMHKFGTQGYSYLAKLAFEVSAENPSRIMSAR